MIGISDSKILICGTARNVSEKIQSFVDVMEICFNDSKQLNFLICESFSDDNTVDVLSDIQLKRENFVFFTDLKISNDENRRTARIASARNQVLEKVREKYSDIDYVVMADLDGVNRDLTAKAVRSCWELSNWDVLCANQPLRYYDIWALRSKGWVENDCWTEFEALKEIYSLRKSRSIAVTSKMRSIRRTSDPIPVQSAFGGLAIYTREAFMAGSYRGLDSAGKEICEHVPFHNDLISKGYKLYINPKLVNLNEISQLGNLFKDLIIKVRSNR